MTPGKSQAEIAPTAKRHIDLRAYGAGLACVICLIGFGLFLWIVSPSPGTRPPDDRAFDVLLPLRRAMLTQAANSGLILAGLAVVGLAIIWTLALRGRRIQHAVSVSIVAVCGLLALQAQVYLMRQRHAAGMALYLFVGAAFFAWLRASPPSPDPVSTGGLSRRTERAVLALILAVALFGRVYDLKRLPYGIDGDESKWTIEVVSTMVDGRDALSSEYHRRYLPMSFWMEAPFQWIIGPGLTPGRIEVAVFSVVASFVFYRLARELTNAPTALVATLLLAVSLPDLTASRAANVESHTKLWAVLPLYGLAVALRTRRRRHFLLTGLALAGAMLTYETLMPIVGATLTLALVAAVRERRAWRAWLPRLAALATAPAAVAVVTIDYLLGRMQYYQGFRSQAEAFAPGEQLLHGIEGVLRPFYTAPMSDALYHRAGPLINGLLVPLLVLGGVYVVARRRERGHAFALTWLAWAFIPIPIVLHSPLPRILYPGVPVLYLFVAIALVTIYRSVSSAVQRPRLTVAIGALVLGSFALLNLTIWFQEVNDTDDELRRREAAEIAVATVEPGSLLLMPYVLPGETVNVEQGLMALLLRERRGAAPAGEIRAVPLREFLPVLSDTGATPRPVNALIDLSQITLPDDRRDVLAAFRSCYRSQRIATTYFELYSMTAADVSDPICRSGRLSLAPLAGVIEGGAAIPIRIEWSLAPVAATRSELTCWRERDGLIWIEGESFGERVGWITDVQHVVGFSGEGYLADNPKSQYAATTVDVSQPGTYRLWVRSYRRQADAFSAFVEIGRAPPAFVGPLRDVWRALAQALDFKRRIFVFGQPLPEALNVWQWQSLADLSLEPGTRSIRLSRPFDLSTGPFIALFVDAIVLSSDLDFDPRRDDRRLPVLQLRGSDGIHSQGAFEVHFEPGRYRCQVGVSDGEKLVDETGAIGITSDPIDFEVKP
jgi:4-amino-4-deoxy-L-arabinose transferase-like glycosyltransferase